MAQITAPSGSTRLAAVIGHPITHSMSPTIMNSAFAELGVDWTYAAFDVEAGGGKRAVESMRDLGIGGLSVTMPLKHEVWGAVDRCTPTADALQSVNCVYRDGPELVGDSTDGEGLIRALRDAGGVFEPSGRTVGVIGAGGAARAVVRSLAEAEASSILVINRTAARAVEAAAVGHGRARAAKADEVTECHLIVNVTPLGMGDLAEMVPVDVAGLRPGAAVVDTIYHPSETRLLRECRAAGHEVINGLPMLIHQAVAQVERWTGRSPDAASMMRAAADNLP